MTQFNRPKKSLGQNFLQSKSIVNRIIKAAAITPKDHVIEIGPGRGILTEELALAAKSVTAIELDSDLIPALRKRLPKNVEILHENALDFIPPKTAAYKIVANIPYYITSPLIRHFLTQPNPPKTLTLLVQKEVAEKICTQPPDSILALQTQLYATPRLAFQVTAKHFQPKPKVDSAVIHLETLAKTARPKNPEQILALAKQAFSQKRKMLSNTLRDHRDRLTELGLQDKRPEHLSIKDWEKLAEQDDL